MKKNKVASMLAALSIASMFGSQEVSPFDKPLLGGRDKPKPPRMPINEVENYNGPVPNGCKEDRVQLIADTKKGPIEFVARYVYGTEKARQKKLKKIQLQFGDFARQVDRLIDWHEKYNSDVE